MRSTLSKIAAVVAAGALTLTLAACGSDTSGNSAAGKTLRVGTLSDAPPSIYLENGRGALYLEGAADLERYAWMFDQLNRLALSPKKSRDLLITVARDL